MFLSTALGLRILLALWLSSAVLGQTPQAQRSSPCFLEMPVYDPFGNRLTFRVVRVAISDRDRRTEILGKTVDGIAIRSSGDRVLFSSNRILGTRPIEVTLEGPRAKRITTQVYVTSCQQRRSLFFGQSDTGFNVAFIQVKGRLSGCRFRGDWWVRVVPMFGGHDGTTAEDGYVEPDGSFSLEAAPSGVRRILVVGLGSRPVRVIGVDVTVGKLADVGLIDLTGACP